MDWRWRGGRRRVKSPKTTPATANARLLLELLHRGRDLLEVVGRQGLLQVLRDQADRLGDGAHLTLRVEARDGRVEARRELQVVELLVLLADRVLCFILFVYVYMYMWCACSYVCVRVCVCVFW